MNAHDWPRPTVWPLTKGDHRHLAEHYADQGTRPEDTAQGTLHALLAVVERLDRLAGILGAAEATTSRRAAPDAR